MLQRRSEMAVDELGDSLTKRGSVGHLKDGLQPQPIRFVMSPGPQWRVYEY